MNRGNIDIAPLLFGLCVCVWLYVLGSVCVCIYFAWSIFRNQSASDCSDSLLPYAAESYGGLCPERLFGLGQLSGKGSKGGVPGGFLGCWGYWAYSLWGMGSLGMVVVSKRFTFLLIVV